MSGIAADGTKESNRSRSESLDDVLRRRLSRRSFLKDVLSGAAVLVADPLWLGPAAATAATGRRPLAFKPISLSTEDRVIVPRGYAAQVLLRWGDPLHPGLSPFDIGTQTATQQSKRFGYNCDFVGYYPLPDHRSRNTRGGLLAVNHEYTHPLMMFPGYARGKPTREQVDVELAAHGVSVVEVGRSAGGRWRSNVASRFNRRVTAETEMEVTGPAAGHPWMKTSYDPTGARVRGTLSNCAGGKTPWGTLLSCEENIDFYFANGDTLPDTDPRKAVQRRFSLHAGPSPRRWEEFYPRFDVAREPNEPFRFGWVVEIDPYTPEFVPKKRTALGRFHHEGATVTLARDGRVAVYSGDDASFEYIYKFVSAGRFDPAAREANLALLDEGTLLVAKFREDGTGEWLPLVFGQGPLVPADGFSSQADVVLNARGAADLLGATKMDRPEDIETNPVNGKVYCVMTNNAQRKPDQTDGANPRADNRHGHIIELTEDGGDPASLTFRWEIFMLCGNPRNPSDGAFFAGFDASRVSPISCPDNIAFDGDGNLWIATDGQPVTLERNDGLYAVPVEGRERGFVRQFLSAPPGAEVTGPEFAPDFTTLFLSIQHPGQGGSLEKPTSRWPDGSPPARPSVVAIWRSGRGPKTIGA